MDYMTMNFNRNGGGSSSDEIVIPARCYDFNGRNIIFDQGVTISQAKAIIRNAAKDRKNVVVVVSGLIGDGSSQHTESHMYEMTYFKGSVDYSSFYGANFSMVETDFINGDIYRYVRSFYLSEWDSDDNVKKDSIYPLRDIDYDAPTQGSANLISSGAVWSALQSKQVNYSTSEQVVGTWIDGKPLYQITKQWQVPTQVTGQWNNYSIGNLGTLEYMNISELAFDYSTSIYRFGNSVGLGTMEVASNFEKVGARLGYNTESGSVFVQLENVGTTSPLYQYGGTLTATIRYTKTTD